MLLALIFKHESAFRAMADKRSDYGYAQNTDFAGFIVFKLCDCAKRQQILLPNGLRKPIAGGDFLPFRQYASRKNRRFDGDYRVRSAKMKSAEYKRGVKEAIEAYKAYFDECEGHCNENALLRMEALCLDGIPKFSIGQVVVDEKLRRLFRIIEVVKTSEISYADCVGSLHLESDLRALTPLEAKGEAK